MRQKVDPRLRGATRDGVKDHPQDMPGIQIQLSPPYKQGCISACPSFAFGNGVPPRYLWAWGEAVCINWRGHLCYLSYLPMTELLWVFLFVNNCGHITNILQGLLSALWVLFVLALLPINESRPSNAESYAWFHTALKEKDNRKMDKEQSIFLKKECLFLTD